MTEAAVVNVFTILRALLLGGILFIFPHITRKGLLFGLYIGEKASGENPAGSLLRRWNRDCVLLTVVALIIGLGISVLGRPVTGNLTCTVIMLLAFPVQYLRYHFEARRLAPPAESQPIGLAAVPAEGRRFGALSQDQVLRLVRDRHRPERDLEGHILTTIRNVPGRKTLVAEMRAVSLPDLSRNFEVLLP